MTQYKKVNEEYLKTLENIWSSVKKLYETSHNPISEIYTMQSIVYGVARNVARVEAITKRYKDAKKRGDTVELKRIKYISDKMGDEKACAILWQTISEDYDNFLNATNEDTDRLTKLKKSVEILDQSHEYLKKAEESTADEIEIDL